MRALLLLATCAALSVAGEDEAKRLRAATETITEMMGTSDRAVPQEILDNSTCAAVIPGMKKAGFIVGGQYGKGFLTCRNDNGTGWKSPAAIRIEGGSVGLQIGGAETDVILLVKSRRGAEKLMSSKFTLGGDVTAAAGPVGREANAQTDLQMRAEILSYSRSRGVFAGISLEGSTLREDAKANAELYGAARSSKEILSTPGATPEVAKPFVAALTKYSGRFGKR
ncbi:MAG: lipid-binding SYLF domain-containing protein [Acidobacteria bacterium]|nr:lipid-binding SYLF domain-containing protein [Acidobacteriota bacterium]